MFFRKLNKKKNHFLLNERLLSIGFLLAVIIVTTFTPFSVSQNNHVHFRIVFAEEPPEEPETTLPPDFCEGREPGDPLYSFHKCSGGGEVGDSALAKKAVGFLVDATAGAFSPLLNAAAFIILALSSLVLGLSAWVLNVAIRLTVVDMATTLDSINAIDVGWVLFRDVANMFFIFIILFIAIATILRIEQYGAKKLLVRLIVAALLINFSLFFTRVIIDVSNVLTNEFYRPIAEFGQFDDDSLVGGLQDNPNTPAAIVGVIDSIGFAGAFMGEMKLLSFFQPGKGLSLFELSSVVFQLLASVFIFIAAFVFLSAGVLFFVRLIMYVILLVTSPIAFLGMVLPWAGNLSQRWWKELISQSLFAPIYMLFATLSFLVITDDAFTDQLDSNGASGFSALFDGGEMFAVVINFIIVCGLLVASLVISKSFGIMGAAKLSDSLTGTLRNVAGWLPSRVGRYANRKYKELTGNLLEEKDGKKPGFGKKALFATLNPVAFAKGWETRAKELEELADSGNIAAGREVSEQLLSTKFFSPSEVFDPRAWKEHGLKGMFKPQLRIPYRQMDERRDENKFMEDYTGMRKETLMAAALDARNMKGAEGDIRRRAIIKAAATQGYLDDMLRMREFAEKYGEADGTIYSAKVLNRFMYDYLGEGEQAQRFMAEDMEDLGRKTGHYEYMGHAYFDNESGTFQRGFKVTGNKIEGLGGREVDELENTWQGAFAAGELAKVSGRERLRIAPHNFTALRAEVERGNDGKVRLTEKKKRADGTEYDATELNNSVTFGAADGKLDDFYKAILSAIDEGDYRELHHSQSRTPKWLLSAEFDKSTGELIVADENDAKKIEALYDWKPEYIRGLYGKFFGMDYKAARENLPGIKIAYYKEETDADGNVTGVRKVQSEKRVGDSSGVAHPILEVVGDGYTKNPEIKFAEFSKSDRERIDQTIKKHLQDMFAGQVSFADLTQEIESKIQDEAPENVTAQNIVEGVLKTMRRTLEDNYDPTPIIKKINGKLKEELTPDQRKNLLAQLPEAYANTWRELTVQKKAMNGPEALERFTQAISEVVRNIDSDLLDRFKKVQGIERLVEQIRPTKKREG